MVGFLHMLNFFFFIWGGVRVGVVVGGRVRMVTFYFIGEVHTHPMGIEPTTSLSA